MAQSPWHAIDTNFPTFTGEESPQEQIGVLLDFMAMLTQNLRYMLQNLSVKNWNSTALEEFQSETTATVDADLKKVVAQVNQMAGELVGISNRLTSAETLYNRMGTAETEIAYLEQEMKTAGEDLERINGQLGAAQADIDELQQRLDGEGGLIERVGTAEAEIAAIKESVKKTETGTVFGVDGKDTHIVGKVYINGVLYE